ncbi:MAG TPA: hypothetical protein VK854_03640, partial [Woeseiaceae bacterium]|nr:hypothetical protein [Woeseiaceae bacterium]
MKIRKTSHKAAGKHRSKRSMAALPALVAAGGGLAFGSAAALELGEIQVQSTLGQPLRASIAYALSPNEIIDDRCVAIGRAGRDLPGLQDARVRVSKGVISITGAAPVMEPMLSANIVVDCPYSAHVSRNYLLFIDPPERPMTVARQSGPATVTAATPSATRTLPAPRPVPARTPVAQGSRYQVQPGDSLSGIVRRLDNPGVSSSSAMAAILDTNPGAFINGDPDLLKAGSWLDIPSFAAGVAAVIPAAKPQDAVAAVSETPDGASAYQGAEALEPDARRQIPATEFLPEVPDTAVSDTIDTAPETTEAEATEAV